MSFISWQYPFFLVGVFLVYWLLPSRFRVFVILASSYYFYAFWDARFLALILFSTTVDYFSGLAMGQQREKATKVVLMGFLPAGWLWGYGLCHPATGPGTMLRLARPGTMLHLAGGVDGLVLVTAACVPLLFSAVYQGIWRLQGKQQRRGFLLLSLANHLGLLCFFKYFDFFTHSFSAVAGLLAGDTHWSSAHIILPVGISFYTFQSISYSVDVYRGTTKPTRDFVTFAAYVAFFPQLLSGPIERSTSLLPQLQARTFLKIENVQAGLRLILVGLFMKVFVADNCALLANHAFDPKSPINGYWAGLGVLAFAFQIYGDFAGYTNIARGSALFLGVDLGKNFIFPYFARGPAEFWRRWHITLSSWFRDYLYIPLGGNRNGHSAALRNTVITMLLAGLWHGASWTFVLWGAYHAFLLILYREVPFFKRLAETTEGWSWRVPCPSALLGTSPEFAPRRCSGRGGGLVKYVEVACGVSLMFIFTLIGWGIFRSRSMDEFCYWLLAFRNWEAGDAISWIRPSYWLLLHIVPLLLLQVATWKFRDETALDHLHWLSRGIIYVVLCLLIASSGFNNQEFIYFQF